MNSKFYDALASAVYLAKLQMQSLTDDDQKIRASGLYADWTAGKHQKGEIYNADGQTWECFQDYDNAVYPDIIPGGAAWGTFNRPLHGKTKETARAWVRPTGAHDIYLAGEFMFWTDGMTYECTAPTGTNFSPEEYSDGWKVAE